MQHLLGIGSVPDLNRCTRCSKVKLRVKGTTLLGGQCSVMLRGNEPHDCDANVTAFIEDELMCMPESQRAQFPENNGYILIADEHILLFANAIKDTLEGDPRIQKERKTTTRIGGARDFKKALLQIAGLMKMKVAPHIQHLITVQTNTLMAGNSKTFHGTQVVTRETAANMFELFNVWISNLQIKVDSIGDELCVVREIVNEVMAEQQGLTVALADVKARTKEGEEERAEMRAQMSALQIALLKMQMTGGGHEQENENPLDVPC